MGIALGVLQAHKRMLEQEKTYLTTDRQRLVGKIKEHKTSIEYLEHQQKEYSKRMLEIDGELDELAQAMDAISNR